MAESRYDTLLFEMGLNYVSLYERGIFDLKMLFTLDSVRHSILLIYNSLVGKRIVTAIEKLSDETKSQLKAECREYTTGKAPDLAVEFAKCYWVLDQLAKIKEGL